MRKELIVGLLSGLIFLQIASPVNMIIKRESVLKNGMPFRFKTAPVDPYDAFRGRYVALRVETNRVPKPQGIDLKSGQKIYAQIAVDDAGFAKISQITTRRPQGTIYLMAQVRYLSGNEVHLDLPIDRYYMEEQAAPLAEQVYRERSRGGQQDAYVVVKIKDGFSVLEGLYIDGKRIEEIVKQEI